MPRYTLEKNNGNGFKVITTATTLKGARTDATSYVKRGEEKEIDIFRDGDTYIETVKAVDRTPRPKADAKGSAATAKPKPKPKSNKCSSCKSKGTGRK